MIDEPVAPNWARSWVVMWVLTMAPLICYALGGFNVGSFKEMWLESWEGLATVMAIGLGVKFGKDTYVRKAEIQASVDKQKNNPTFSEAGSD